MRKRLLPEWDGVYYKSNPLPKRELLLVVCQNKGSLGRVQKAGSSEKRVESKKQRAERRNHSAPCCLFWHVIPDDFWGKPPRLEATADTDANLPNLGHFF
jgi:hypothetical protein